MSIGETKDIPMTGYMYVKTWYFITSLTPIEQFNV